MNKFVNLFLLVGLLATSCQSGNQETGDVNTVMNEYGGQVIGRPLIPFTQKTKTFIRKIHPYAVVWHEPENVEVKQYRILVYYDNTVVKDAYTSECSYDLTQVWKQIPQGYFFICLFAEDVNQELVAASVVLSVFKASDFIREKLNPRVAYEEAARKTLNWLMNYKADMSIPHNQETVFAPDEPIALNHIWVGLSNGKVDGRLYPGQHSHLWINTYLKAYNRYQETDPDFARACLAFAEKYAKKALKESVFPDGFVYEHLIAQMTGEGKSAAFRWAKYWPGGPLEYICAPPFSGMIGSSFIKLYQATGKEIYREASIRIAETLKKTQKEDGSWSYYVNAKTGEVYYDYTSVNSMAAVFFDEVIKSFPDLEPKYKEARDKSWKWVFENPVQTMRWENQFADVKPHKPYEDIGGFDTWWFTQYLLDNYSDDPDMVATAEKLLRHLEDNFVYFKPDHFATGYRGSYADFICPCVGEQHGYPYTMGWGTAEWTRVCFKLWHATQNKEYLDKARAGAAVLTYGLSDEGIMLTYSVDRVSGQSGKPRDDLWLNCALNPAMAWMELSDLSY
ncbi:MAG: hypothetical protein ABFS38_12020 [Bacteroidota bacterium]